MNVCKWWEDQYDAAVLVDQLRSNTRTSQIRPMEEQEKERR